MISRAAALPDDFARIDALFRRCEQADVIDLDIHRHALQEPHTTDLFYIWLDSEIDGLIEGRFWYYLRPITAQGQGIESSAPLSRPLMSALLVR